MNVEYLSLSRDRKYKRWSAVVYTDDMIIPITEIHRWRRYCYFNKRGCLTGFDYRGLRMCLFNEFGIELPNQEDLILLYSETANPFSNVLKDYYAVVGIPYIYKVYQGQKMINKTGCY